MYIIVSMLILSVAVPMVTTMLTIRLLPHLLILNWSKAWAVATYCSVAVLALARDLCADLGTTLIA